MFFAFERPIFIDFHLNVSHQSKKPLCFFDEGVLLTKFPVGFNSSNGNHHFSSIVSGADKQVLEMTQRKDYHLFLRIKN